MVEHLIPAFIRRLWPRRSGHVISHEIRALTGIRGLAALAVMLYHYRDDEFLGNGSLWAFHSGYLSVDLFFVLSGFMLTLRYQHFFARKIDILHWLGFMRERISRIYPVYAMAMALYLVRWHLDLSGKGGHEFSAADIIANLFAAQSWGWPNIKEIVGASWSVSVEMLSYLFFPFLILLILKRSARANLALFALLILSAATLVLLYICYPGVRGPFDIVNGLPAVFRCASEFCLGMLAYRLTQNTRAANIMGRNAVFAGLFAALIVAFLIPGADLLFAAAATLVIASLSTRNTWGEKLLGNRAVHFLGVISYSLYLLHSLIGDAMRRMLMHMPERFHSFALFVLLAGGVSLIAAHLCQRFIETPGRRALDRLFQRLFPALPAHKR